MKSLWSDSANPDERQPKILDGSIKTDVLVIGGGMAGVLCAHRLTQKGVSCILVDAAQTGDGVTKNTTAKITAQHGLIYADLIKKSGLSAAQKYYASQTLALEEYRRLSGRIPCDFEDKTAYVYSVDDRKKLENEAAAYKKLGIPVRLEENPPLPFSTAGALGMMNQAQFHPLKLLYALTREIDAYENTFITKIDGHRAFTKNGEIAAKYIVLATHFPLVNIPGGYFLKMYQHRSYVLALQNAATLNGMYVDEREDGHSFRNYGDMLLIGGGDHRTGKKGGGFEELRSLARWAYPKSREKYAWATQDCMTLDSMAYIGIHRKSAPYLYVATGFNKWGMTGAMTSAVVLSDLIITGKSEFSELFSP